jgi:hypothetical protein
MDTTTPAAPSLTIELAPALWRESMEAVARGLLHFNEATDTGYCSFCGATPHADGSGHDLGCLTLRVRIALASHNAQTERNRAALQAWHDAYPGAGLDQPAQKPARATGTHG